MGCRLGELYKENEVEERVLDFLRPPKKLEQLIIENYGGVKFSSWIADSSLKNLSSLKLRNCKNCKSLPSIGRLPLLKDLSIIGFDQVQKIGVELFGENQLNPFASLEILYFQSLPNWEEWDTCEGDEKVLKLPSLRELSIKTCPQLLGRLPTHLPSFIRGCAELVDDCSSTAKDLSSLQTMSVSNISKFNIPADRTMLRFGNSEHFEIDGWEELASLSRYGFSLVGYRFISVWRCPQLQYLEAEEAELQPDKISCVESLLIYDCERLNRLPQVLHELIFPTVMEIYRKPFQSFSALKAKLAWKCFQKDPLKEKGRTVWLTYHFPLEGFPANLASLAISNAPKIYRSLVEWGLSRLTSFQELIIRGVGCSNVVSFPEEGTGMMLPPSLTRIILLEFENLEYMSSKGFQDLASLKELDIGKCPKLTSLPEKDVLLSLGYLHIYRYLFLKEECSSDKG
ncbi:hypothetical protein GOBAR_AA36788 [Gossypium barbadense]|uniref:R13L1/DRL21-like LRR repeat region domain-containing protein n=1 Tax=Gossypium barbadense TaxID=3634 RepID=A0A2P5VYJ6_GOSBA|nr:hypothetical protein GOBAR_AA36788 [Gossypium barbadense]